jgi:transcriptional regulator with XRE-family HTH domain
LRSAAGLSLRQVEKLTGVSNAYLSQLENGRTRNPSLTVLRALGDLYAVPIDSLLAHGMPNVRSASRYASPTQVALMSANLTQEEQVRVHEFIDFLISQRR